jgi:hypothetical protein
MRFFVLMRGAMTPPPRMLLPVMKMPLQVEKCKAVLERGCQIKRLRPLPSACVTTPHRLRFPIVV